jgi:hypothetical protein
VSAQGQIFSVGDRLNLPPPLPRGSVWTVIAVEAAQTEGYDGTLVLEPASSTDPAREPPSDAFGRDESRAP